MIRVILGVAVLGAFATGLGLIGLAAGGADSLDAYLILATLLFSIGMFGFLARRNAISMLMSIELMLNAANVTLLAYGRARHDSSFQAFAFLVVAVAAAEAAVGLAIVVGIFRNRHSANLDELTLMKR
jgi:NADH-quinone oxidoreductase subunit K